MQVEIKTIGEDKEDWKLASTKTMLYNKEEGEVETDCSDCVYKSKEFYNFITKKSKKYLIQILQYL